MKTLEELRKEIDQIDKELHNLLVRRIEIGQEVAKAKKINSGLNLRPGREAQIMKRLVLRNTPPLSATSLEAAAMAGPSALADAGPMAPPLHGHEPRTV